jgi:hypothetical protein
MTNYTYRNTAVVSEDTRKIVGLRCSKKESEETCVVYRGESIGDDTIKLYTSSVLSQNFYGGNILCNGVFLMNLHLGKSDKSWQKE